MQFSGITSGAKSDGLSGGSLPTGVCVCVCVHVCVCVCVPVCVRVYVCVHYMWVVQNMHISHYSIHHYVHSARHVICCTYVHVYMCMHYAPCLPPLMQILKKAWLNHLQRSLSHQFCKVTCALQLSCSRKELIWFSSYVYIVYCVCCTGHGPVLCV